MSASTQYKHCLISGSFTEDSELHAGLPRVSHDDRWQFLFMGVKEHWHARWGTGMHVYPSCHRRRLFKTHDPWQTSMSMSCLPDDPGRWMVHSLRQQYPKTYFFAWNFIIAVPSRNFLRKQLCLHCQTTPSRNLVYVMLRDSSNQIIFAWLVMASITKSSINGLDINLDSSQFYISSTIIFHEYPPPLFDDNLFSIYHLSNDSATTETIPIQGEYITDVCRKLFIRFCRWRKKVESCRYTKC